MDIKYLNKTSLILKIIKKIHKKIINCEVCISVLIACAITLSVCLKIILIQSSNEFFNYSSVYISASLIPIFVFGIIFFKYKRIEYAILTEFLLSSTVIIIALHLIHVLVRMVYNINSALFWNVTFIVSILNIGFQLHLGQYKKIKNLLNEKNQLLNETQRLAKIGSWYYNLNTGKYNWSDETFRIYGILPSNNNNLSLDYFMQKIYYEDRQLLLNWIAQCKESLAPSSIEFRALFADGTMKYLLGNGALYLDKFGLPQFIMGTVQDISEHKKLSESLLKAKAISETALDIKSTFLASMSHEIKTPISAIIGLSDLALLDHLNLDIKDYLEKIKKTSVHLLHILNHILDYSKIEAGKMEVEKKQLNLTDVFENLYNIFFISAREKNIQLIFDVEKTYPLNIYGDPFRLQQVLCNLLNNAIKFTEKGFVKLTLKTLQIDSESLTIQFLVSDSGIGISKVDISNLIVPYGQADVSISGRYGGTGLGLFISQKILNIMGSQLKIDSVLGVGTAISFELKFDLMKTLEKENIECNNINKDIISLDQLLKNKCKNIQGLKILLVEDNQINQIIIKKYLSMAGLLYEVAENGKLAIEHLNKNKFQAIIMDLQMPVMDGFQTTREIRLNKNHKNIPIIALTAEATCNEKNNCINAGMNDFISKPIDPNILIETLVRILN